MCITNLLNVVVGKSAAILELLASKDQALLVGGNALLILDLLLDTFDGVRRLDLEGNSLTRKGLHEDLHCREREASASHLTRSCRYRYGAYS